jgi:hypothetical protein
MKSLRKATKNLSQYSRSPGRDLNPCFILFCYITGTICFIFFTSYGRRDGGRYSTIFSCTGQDTTTVHNSSPLCARNEQRGCAELVRRGLCCDLELLAEVNTDTACYTQGSVSVSMSGLDAQGDPCTAIIV